MTLFSLGPDVKGKAAEKAWQKTLEETLTTFGWKWMHVYPMMDRNGMWRTPTSGTLAKGWVDHICFRREYVLGIEVKGYDARGRPTAFQPGQVECLETIAALTTGRAWVLRPTDDHRTIVEWLRYPQDAPVTFGWSEADRVPPPVRSR